MENETKFTPEQEKTNREQFKKRLINEGKIPAPDKDGKKSNIYGYKEPWK
jgi:hypothetical protein